MIDALRRAVGERRWTFVVGRGGAGKTTTAGALALAMADAGEAVHLVSTDPAHSLFDLFGPGAGQRPGVSPSPCTERLRLEELDADREAEAWRREYGADLAVLLERGSWLDAGEAGGLIALRMPGVDEVMAALRLVALDGEAGGCVVVDTAPAGHTLGLLAVPELLDRWVDAFRAMEAKAEAVAEAMVHRTVRLSAARALDALEEARRRFEDLTAGAAFVVVQRPGGAGEPGTRRLVEALAGRGVHPVARVVVGTRPRADDHAAGDGADPAVLVAPWMPEAAGCDGLRELARRRDTATSGAASGEGRRQSGSVALQPAPDAAPDPRVAELLGWGDTLLFVGKGGVGKSTCAAAAAVGLAERAPVMLYGADPAGSLTDLFGVEVGTEPVDVAPGVHALQVDAAAELARLRDRYRDRVDAAFEAVGLGGARLDREVTRALLDLAPPGADEIFAVSALAEHEGRLVVDTAATGHFLRLLATPALVLDWVHELMRVLLRQGSGQALEDLGGLLLETARKLRRFESRIRDPRRTGAIVVEKGGALVRAETARLRAALDGSGVALRAIICNDGDIAGRGGSGGVPRIVAPEVWPPPAGAAGLRDFFHAWRVV